MAEVFWVVAMIWCCRLYARGPFRTNTRFDAVVFAIACQIFVVAFVSLLVARFAAFSLTNVSVLSLVVAGLSRYLSLGTVATREETPQAGLRPQWFFVAVLLALTASHLAFPTYFILGSRDYGLYLLHMAHIGQSGGANYDLIGMRDLVAQFGNAMQGAYMALYGGQSADPAHIEPQFLQLYGSLGANFYALVGLEGAVRVNAIVGASFLSLFYVFVRRFIGPWGACLAAIGLGINAAMIFSSRITMTEIFAAQFTIAGMIFMSRALDRDSLPAAIWAGVILGAAQFNRIDGFLNIFVMVGFALAVLVSPNFNKRHLLLPLLAYVLVVLAGIWESVTFSWVYLKAHFPHGWRDAALVNIVASSSVLFVAALPRSAIQRFCREDWLRAAAVFATAGLLAWSVYAYGFRVSVEGDTFDARALREISWYVNPIALLLFLCGLGVASRSRDFRAYLPAAAIFIATYFLFSYAPSISRDHYWATRRWIPHVFPGIVFFSAVALVWLWRRAAQWRPPAVLTQGVVAVCVLVYVGTTIELSRAFFFTSLLSGVRDGYADFVAQAKEAPKGIATLARNNFLASPLTYIYQLPTFMLSYEPVVDRLEREGKFAGYRYVDIDPIALMVEPDIKAVLCGMFPEKTVGERPRHLEERCYTAFSAIMPDPKNQDLAFKVPPAFHRIGKHRARVDFKGTSVVSNGQEGTILYGPYLSLPPGVYRVRWMGRFLGGEKGKVGDVAITRDGGKVALQEKSIVAPAAGQVLVEVVFGLEKEAEGIELKLAVDQGTKMQVDEIGFRRIRTSESSNLTTEE